MALTHKEEKGYLEIKLPGKNGLLCRKLPDNGVDCTAVLRQNKPVESSIMITDLVLPDGTARGTEVVITIPIHRD